MATKIPQLSDRWLYKTIMKGQLWGWLTPKDKIIVKGRSHWLTLVKYFPTYGKSYDTPMMTKDPEDSAINDGFVRLMQETEPLVLSCEVVEWRVDGLENWIRKYGIQEICEIELDVYTARGIKHRRMSRDRNPKR